MPRTQDDRFADRPRGFTLVELLVAATISLSVMAAVATLFGIYGRSFSQSKEITDMVGQMRTAAWRLRQDLQGVTVEVAPWIRPEANAGYFELIEGPLKDTSAANGTTALLADVDDVLLFTTRTTADAFVGRLGAGAIESPYAEVAWFCRPGTTVIDGQTLQTLHRRQLLVAASVGAGTFATSSEMAFSSWTTYYADNDLSVHRLGSALFLNSLGDLSKRECRFLHNSAGTVSRTSFPYPFSITSGQGEILTGNREGEDVVLRNVVAFDVRVFDADNPTRADPYVDLGAGQSTGRISGAMNEDKSKLTVPTYDTWSLHYEFNGIDEDGANGIDQGTNATDDNGDKVIDDLLELETAPPYAVSLRGLEVRIRCIDPSSKEIRQVTVRTSFATR